MKTKSFQIWVLLITFCLVIAHSASATGYTLTLFTNGSGGLRPDNTNNPHPSGSIINITATASNGWYFSSWSGDASGTNNPLQVTMNSNLVITGSFLPFPIYSVSLTTNGQGGIDLNPPGASDFSNTLVTATATPAAGWVFVAWSGVTNTGANPVSFTVNTNVSLDGAFAQLPGFDVQPVSVTNKVTSTVTLYGHSVGTSPLGYQWFFSGGSIPYVATNATLALTNASSGQAGNYWVVATNAYGNATSTVASVTLTNFSGPTNVVNMPIESGLRAAIALGGWIGIGFNGTVIITNTINITNNVILDASTVAATISGGNAVRLFCVTNGASLTLSNLTLANGSCLIITNTQGTNADGGAIYNCAGNVSLTGCTVSNCSAQSLIYGGTGRGGAIFNTNGMVVVNQSVLVNNSAIGGGSYIWPAPGITATGEGGAIYNVSGTCIISGCNLSSNLCEAFPYSDAYNSYGSLGSGLAMGGAVFQASGSIGISNSVFSFNSANGESGVYTGPFASASGPAYGGALNLAAGSASISGCQFLSNLAAGGSSGYYSDAVAYGGAISSGATLTIADSTFSGDHVLAGNSTDYHYQTLINGYGGAIYNSGMAVMNRCSVYSNYVQGGHLAPNALEQTTGFAGLGGGVFNDSQFAATNCTFALNTAVGGLGGAASSQFGTTGNALGGGICNNATFAGMNLTIANNLCLSPSGAQSTNGVATGFQIANLSGTLRLHNSILAYSGTNANANGAITDNGYNICSDASASLESGSSYNNTDPQLQPLGNYGGPTLCMNPLASSPAIDFGDSNGAPATDQRGYARPYGSGFDIGAVEYSPPPPAQPVLSLSSTTTNFQLSFTATLSGTYYLQSSTNLITWMSLSTNGPVTGTTNIIQAVARQGLKACYFRLLVQ